LVAGQYYLVIFIKCMNMGITFSWFHRSRGGWSFCWPFFWTSRPWGCISCFRRGRATRLPRTPRRRARRRPRWASISIFRWRRECCLNWTCSDWSTPLWKSKALRPVCWSAVLRPETRSYEGNAWNMRNLVRCCGCFRARRGWWSCTTLRGRSIVIAIGVQFDSRSPSRARRSKLPRNSHLRGPFRGLSFCRPVQS